MYRLKKSLGQHFLKDKSVIDKILKAVEGLSAERLLEVGPGGGAMTDRLLKTEGIDFKAVEIDEEKVTYLQEKLPGLHLIHQSFLDMQPPFNQPFSIVGNFPYNISSQILFRIIDWFPQVENVIGMFQQEVAERIVSDPGSKNYGVLSVLIQFYYEPAYLFTVGRECFNPPPRVSSAVISLKKRTELPVVTSESDFKKLVKASFAQRRKTLRNNLKGMLPAEKLSDPLFDRRAETLSVSEFAGLTFLAKK